MKATRVMRRTCAKFIAKGFNSLVILILVLQPVGAPGLLGVFSLQQTAFAAEENVTPPVEEEADAPAPKEEREEPAVEEVSEPVPEVAEESSPTSTKAPSDEMFTVEEEITLSVEKNPTNTQAEEVPGEEAPVVIEETPETSPETTTEETSATEEEVVAEETPAEETVAEKPVEEVACLSASVTESDESDWTVDGDKAVTTDPVELGVRYVYPLDKEVTITFTCLPTDVSKRVPLSIERIEASDLKLPEGTVAVSEYAYDITTGGMENGNFKYDLTLPKFEGVKDADISYIEMSLDEVKGKELKKSEVKEVSEDKIDNKNESVTAVELSHFTIFVPTVDIRCQNDVNGANDYPGQKDLTKMCVDYHYLPTTLNLLWNWDEIAWSGGNTGDACSLFDTDNDGKANYALCVTVAGDPASYQSKQLYLCNDTKSDRCAGDSQVSSSADTQCTSDIEDADPFPTGTNSPKDTVASCTIKMSDISASSVKLLDVCSYPSKEPNSAPSDCIVWTAEDTGKLEIIKKIVPVSDSGRFDLSLDGTVYTPVGGVGDGGSTGEQAVLSANMHTFNEAGNSTTNLSDYSTAVVCKDNDGTGSVVPTTGSFPWSISVGKDKDIVCTITNTRKSGTIVIVKDAQPNDAQDFSFTSDIPTAASFTLDDDGDNSNALSNTQTFTGVLPGTYTVTEAVAASFDLTGLACTDPTKNSTGDLGTRTATIDLASNETVTCTFTNTKKPTLTLVKRVTNDNGGTAVASAWTLNASGPTPISGVTGSASVTSATVDAGTYTLSETGGPTGYTASTWVCTGTGTQNGSDITLTVGQSATCTITNDDQAASLTVIKHVVNDHGGAKVAGNFTIKVTGTDVSTPSFPGSETGTVVTLDAGSYSIDELSVFGYAKTLGANCSGSIALGEQKTCTITNNDIQPQLTVIKIVENTDGGNLQPSDFTIHVSGNTVSPTSFQGSAGQLVTLNAGGYSVTEDVISGYTPQYSPDCNGTIAIGETKTCTITNADVAPTLTLVKTVINNNGGTKSVSDFPLFVNDNPVTSGTPVVLQANTQYTVSETNLYGYAASSWGGDCAADGTITLTPGEDATCTITNDDIQPKLTVTKVVVNDGLGTKTVSDFPLFVGQTGVTSGVQNGFNAGTFTVSETPPTGYTGVISGDCAANGSVTLSVGDVKNCTITNNDTLGKIIVEKQTLPDGSAQSFTFIPSYGQNFNLSDGQQHVSETLPSGIYSVSETVPAGWDLAPVICSDGSTPDAIRLQDNEIVTCVFTNTKRATIIVKKDAVSNDAQDFLFSGDLGSFTLDDDSGAAGSNSTYSNSQLFSVVPGTYAITEGAVSGWKLSGASCVVTGTSTLHPVNLVGRTLTTDLFPGTDVTCIFTNKKLGSITIVKNTVGGDGTFDYVMTGNTLPASAHIATSGGIGSQTFTGIDPENTYSVKESPVPAGWDLTNVNCVNNLQTVKNPVSFQIPNGGNVTCTFTNTKRGSITVVKNTVGGDGQFSFTSNFGVSGLTTTAGTASQTVNNLVPGNYSVSETVPAGWNLTNATCSDQSDPSQISLEPGEEITCVFTNTQLPTLTVNKVLVPSDNVGLFNLSIDSVTEASNVGDGGTTGAVMVSVGAHTVSETAGTGTDLALYTAAIGQDCAPDGSITLAAGEDKTCVITNTRNTGKIVVSKVIDADGNLQTTEDQAPGIGWEFTVTGNTLDTSLLSPGLTDNTGTATFDPVKTGTYNIAETALPGYAFVDALCSSGSPDGPTVYGVTVGKDMTVTCTFYNAPNGTIHGYKWHDLDGNQEVDEDEGKLSNWTIELYRSNGEGYNLLKTMVTSSDTGTLGEYHFDHLFPGEYKVCEVVKPGWQQTYPINEGEDCHFITLPHVMHETNGENHDPMHNFGNQFIAPDLTIEKFNNQWDNGTLTKQPGDIVDYTIIVTASKNTVNGVTVTDLPPEGFEYIPGTGAASSSLGSDHSGPLELSSPYASPGTWSLGNIVDGEVITLSYKAKIATADPGIYKDLAWAVGTDGNQEQIVADSVVADTRPVLDEDTGVVSDRFVGTQVAVTVTPAPQTVDLKKDEKTETRTKRVLGAALPATGANTLWLLLAGLLLALGSGLILLGRRKQVSNPLMKVLLFPLIGFLVIGLSGTVQANGVDPNISVRIEEPKSSMNTSAFKISFVALDIEGEKLSAQCYKKPGNETIATTFDGSVSGGNSGTCDVNLPDGTYQFYVVVTAGEGRYNQSTDVEVTVATAVPGKPRNYDRDGDNCGVDFTTADDGLTGKVEMYRSDELDFTADASTLVQTVAILPNTNGTIVDPLGNCDDYYYAIRAVSAAGIGSAFTGDEKEVVERRTRTIVVPAPSAGTGAIPVAAPTTTPAEGTVEGVTTEEDAGGEEGAVLGEKTSEETIEGGFWNWIRSHPWWSLLAILALIALIYAYRRRKGGGTESGEI